jgi:hypothetical protein
LSLRIVLRGLEVGGILLAWLLGLPLWHRLLSLFRRILLLLVIRRLLQILGISLNILLNSFAGLILNFNLNDSGLLTGQESPRLWLVVADVLHGGANSKVGEP